MKKVSEGIKCFMDPRRKKLKENNSRSTKRNVEEEKKTSHITPDVLQNSCFYCTKVFINSKYLLKHLLRRHSEEVVNFHKKYSESETCDLKSLFTAMEKEFSELKKEIFVVKQVMGLEIYKREEEPQKRSKEADCFPAKVVESNGVIMTECRSNEVQMLEHKLNNIEEKVQFLCDKLEENDKNMNSKFLLKQDIHQCITHTEEKFLWKQEAQFVEMRQVLLVELKSLLDKRLHENNIDWKVKVTELKDDILKLDQVLASVRKQINSPEYIQDVEKKLENRIFHFLNNIGQTTMKRKSIKPKTNASTKIRASENNIHESKVSLKRNMHHLNQSQGKLITNPNITSEKLKSTLITETLSSFGICSNTVRLSNSEYEEKLRLVNINKDYLKRMYHNFPEVYNYVNISADQRVLSKLKPKQKLRFSEPLILNKDISSNLLPNKTDFLNKTSPFLKEEINSDFEESSVSRIPAVTVPKSEGFIFQKDSGSGDCSDNFQDHRNKVKKIFGSTEGKRFHTSSPVTEANDVKKSRNSFSRNNSFVEFSENSSEEKKLICATPSKRASHIILDDDTSLNKKTIKYSNKTGAWDKISEIDNEEKSFSSLSSLEDDYSFNNPNK